MGKNCSPFQIRRSQCTSISFLKLVSIIVLTMILVPLATRHAVAQNAPEQQAPATAGIDTQRTIGFGINAVVSHTPQEESLSDIGGEEEIDKFELFIDWSWLRVGFNMTHAAFDFTRYNQNWKTRLRKDTTYAAYRLSSAGSQSKWDLFLLAGLAYTDATYTIINVNSSSSADWGAVTGGGIFYRMGRLDLGVELLVISTQGEFDNVKIATGSTQVLTGMKYNF